MTTISYWEDSAIIAFASVTPSLGSQVIGVNSMPAAIKIVRTCGIRSIGAATEIIDF